MHKPGRRWTGWGRAGGAAAMLLMLGCAATGIRVDYDHEADFSVLMGYAWMDSAATTRDSGANPFLERRLRRSVDRALQDRGFVPDSADPDFLVTALVFGPSGEQRWNAWSTAPCGPVVSLFIGWGYPFGYGPGHGHRPWRSPYFPYPWGLACGYRVGFGYAWIPLYQQPGGGFGGTLVIDVLDARTRDLIWRGSAEGVALSFDGDAAPQEEVDEVVRDVLRTFPPRPRN